MDRKKFLNTLWMIFICVSFFAIGWLSHIRFTSKPNLLQSAHQLILTESFFNRQSDTELSYAAIRGMLSVIDDPYSELIEFEAAQDLLDTFTGNTGVVGLYAENQAGNVVILNVFPDGAAQNAGIEVGDIILSIDGNPLDEDTDSSETGLLIRGVPGTSVNLKIQRDGNVHEYELIRQSQDFVTYYMLPGDIAYLSLYAFNKNATQNMKHALDMLLEQEPVGLIWDLRNNEGGDMQAAQDILSFFIDEGLLFSAELTGDRKVQFFANGGAIAEEIPLVVLIDGTAYSAAETAAAAVVELGRGTTIGTESYGKGLIQATMPLPNGSLLQMTIAKWLSVNGEWYHERGVAAQIEVSDDPTTEIDEVIQKGVDVLLNRH